MNIPYNAYIKKLSACYLGKAIGGTLGMPFEGKPDTNTIEYYTPIPKEMCGNDDLDLQVVWLETLLKTGFPVNRYHLSQAWRHLNFGPDEYCIALHNLRNQIYAPLSGAYGNKFNNGMGAAIRSELWAAIAPGEPRLAVALAREDACVDHCGSGISACVFLTAIESAAYTEHNTEKLIETGLSFISSDVRFTTAIRDTVAWWKESGQLFDVREKILKKYACDNWTDVTINVSLIILAWLAGEGNFGKSICCAANCGYDADCTAATLGALLGILNPNGIEKKWFEPIGNKLVISPQILGIRTSETMMGLCEKICAVSKRCSDYYRPETHVSDIPINICRKADQIPIWTADPAILQTGDTPMRESLFSVTPVAVRLIYPEHIALEKNKKQHFTAVISNPSDTRMEISLKLRLPECFIISEKAFCFHVDPLKSHSISFDIESLVSYKTAFDSLDFCFLINGIAYTVSAGIVCAYPWVLKEGCGDTSTYPDNTALQGAVYSPAYSLIKTVNAGSKSLAIDVRPAMPQQVAFTCQGTRRLKLWVNGDKIFEYNAGAYVPSLHRGSSVLARLNNTWNRIVIQLEDGPSGEVFLAIGNPVDWIWLNTVEWRQPEI